MRRFGRFLTAEELPQVLERLRALLARGNSIRAAAELLAAPKSTVADLAKRHQLQRRRRGLSREKRDAVRRCLRKMGGRKAADIAGVSRWTTWRYQQLAQFRKLLNRSNTPLPCKPWRCPGGGELLNVSLCLVHGCRKPPNAKRARTAKTARKAG